MHIFPDFGHPTITVATPSKPLLFSYRRSRKWNLPTISGDYVEISTYGSVEEQVERLPLYEVSGKQSDPTEEKHNDVGAES
jgi:hypothetical protein